MNLEEEIDQFLHYLREIKKLSSSTIATYTTIFNELKGYFELERDSDRYILNITSFRIKNSSLSKRSISKKLSAIRSFVKYLNKIKNINVVLKGANSIKTPKTLPKPINEEYIKEALEYAPLFERVLIEILYGAGLRISEAANLKIEDIKNGWIRIRGKGDKIREIPLLPSLKELIDQFIKEYNPNIYLFEIESKKLNEAQLRYRVQKLFKKMGIKVTPHQLRHSFASHMLQEGARVTDIKELLGHASISTTQIYTKLSSIQKLKEYKNSHPLAKED